MRKIFKKLLPPLLAAMFVLGTAAGCGEINRHGLDPQNPTEVTLWHYYSGSQKAALDRMTDEFNTGLGAELGITVVPRQRGSINDVAAAVIASANGEVGADPLPDMFLAYTDTAYTLDQKDLLVDLSDYLTKEEREEYVESYMSEGSYLSADEIKIFPVAKSTEVLMLNRTDWEKFAELEGVSVDSLSTWEGIVGVAKKYYERYDKAFFSRDAFANYMIIGSKQLGHPILDAAGGSCTYRYDEATLRKLWDNYYVPYVNGWFTAEGKHCTDDLKTGTVIAGVGATSGMTYFPSRVINDAQDYAIEGAVYPVPNFAGCEKYAVQQGAGVAVIKSNETREYASSVFLHWFTDSARNWEFCLGSSYLPVKKEANTEAALSEAIAGAEVKDIVVKALRVGVEMTNQYEMYTTKAFPAGQSARNVLETSMKDWAKEDREKVERGEADLGALTADGHFQEWVQSLKSQLGLLTLYE